MNDPNGSSAFDPLGGISLSKQRPGYWVENGNLIVSSYLLHVNGYKKFDLCLISKHINGALAVSKRLQIAPKVLRHRVLDL